MGKIKALLYVMPLTLQPWRGLDHGCPYQVEMPVWSLQLMLCGREGEQLGSG